MTDNDNGYVGDYDSGSEHGDRRLRKRTLSESVMSESDTSGSGNDTVSFMNV